MGASQVDPPLTKTRPLFKSVAAGEDRAVFSPLAVTAKEAVEGS
jgi:hypothetical protein